MRRFSSAVLEPRPLRRFRFQIAGARLQLLVPMVCAGIFGLTGAGNAQTLIVEELPRQGTDIRIGLGEDRWWRRADRSGTRRNALDPQQRWATAPTRGRGVGGGGWARDRHRDWRGRIDVVQPRPDLGSPWAELERVVGNGDKVTVTNTPSAEAATSFYGVFR